MAENQEKTFFIGALIMSLIGGVLLLVADFGSWYNYTGTTESWGWISFDASLDSSDLIGILLFLFAGCSLLYCSGISLLELVDPEKIPSLSWIKIGMILAAIVTVICLLGGLAFVVDMTSDEPTSWGLEPAFYGGVIGGGLTTLFLYLALQEE